MEGDEQDTILNDLLTQIKNLEDKNASLKEEIKAKEEQLASGNLAKVTSLKDEKIPSMPSITLCKEEGGEEDIPVELKSLLQNEAQIKSNVVEYVIEYIPVEQVNKLYISGDFTNWDLKQMTKNQDIFSYTVVLLKNFKYYYSLSDMNQSIVDVDKPYEINPINNIEQNYIDLCEPERPKVTFDGKKQNNILSLARRNYLILKMGNIKEANFLLEVQKNAEIFNEKCNTLSNSKNTLIESISNYYDSEIEAISPIDKTIMTRMMEMFKGRILCKNSKNPNTNIIYYYEIISINDTYVNAIQLYDDNHIKTNYHYYLQNELYYVVPLDSITATPITTDSKDFHILSSEESKKIITDYKNDTDNILKVYFKLDEDEIKANESSYKAYGTRVAYPRRIEPERINSTDYLCEESEGKIVQVKHKLTNTTVQFIYYEDKEIKEKKPPQILFYYTINRDKQVCIIHTHILDKSLVNKEIIIKHIEQKTDFHKLKAEEEYVKKDKMLLLIRSMMPFRLYYNKKKVHIERVNIQIGKIYRINATNMSSAFNHYYVKVENIPPYSIVFSEKEKEKCNYDVGGECGEEMLLYESPSVNKVDVFFLFDENKNVIMEEMKFSFTPCLLQQIDNNQESALQNLYESNKEKMLKKEANVQKDSYELKKLELINKEIKKFEKYKNDEKLIEEIDKKEIENYIFMFEDYKNSMNTIGTYIETNELWDLISQVSLTAAEIDEFITLFNKYK